ncbi:putative bifunctional diguanylate cyclase/phosphodiesterase [Cryptosporangium sp. NPDC048952]|uniref:putative bifunctional diguanylate cyclase/phosphodiesterase n=1 Tax=Cryptosporangium sp. NPDC048952 TaxID=3363961 RepID=UPI003722E599
MDAWAAQQLPEYLAVVSSRPDVAAAALVAAEWAAELMEAEVGAVVLGDRLEAQVGFPRGAAPSATLVLAAAQRRPTIDVPGLGACVGASVGLGADMTGHLLVARSGAPFGAEELSLLRGMGRILGLQLRQIETLASMQQRQRLLEEFARVQRAITMRSPLQEILDAITTGIHALFERDMVSLRLLDTDDPDWMMLASQSGMPDWFAVKAGRLPVTDRGFQHVLRTGEILMVNRQGIDDYTDEVAISTTVQAAMVAPVSEDGVRVGCLLVASFDPERRYDERDSETLQGFADHVSMALTDARGVQALHQAHHDALTGLPNRTLLKIRLGHALGRGPCGLLFVDLDRFKLVNDSLGHDAGDQLLIETADRLREAVGPGNTVARYGGDEFVVLVDRIVADVSEVTAVAERVLAAVEPPYVAAGRECSVGASIGVTVAGAADAPPSADEVLRDADVAMYRAKHRGRGCIEVFHPEMHAVLMERLDLEADLRRAVEQGELFLVYQPIVELATLRAVRFEALARWNHPTRGLLGPDLFIPLAEETGLIASIGRWVVGEAMRAAQRWDAAWPGARELGMTVNLAVSHLRLPGAAAEIAGMAAAIGYDPSRLTVEVTENELVRDHDVAVDALFELRELGVSVAVDDFGTGFSSLRYLRQLPVNAVKIDRSFVVDVDTSPEGLAFARSIVGLGTALSLCTVAEGIERETQLTELRRIGCTYGQGFALARPLDEPAVLPWLSSRDGDPHATAGVGAEALHLGG